MRHIHFAAFILVIACLVYSCTCKQSCSSGYVSFIAYGFTKAELDGATITTYDQNGTFSTNSLRGSYIMDSAWASSNSGSDTCFCNTYYGYNGIPYNQDYKISIPATGDVFQISGITFDGQFSVTDYCNGGDPSGPQCSNPAHLTAYTVNGNTVTSITNNLLYPNTIYLIK